MSPPAGTWTYLSQEVVGAVSVVVPDGDLERAVLKLNTAQRTVVEGLVPARVESVGDGLGAAFRLLTNEMGRKKAMYAA